jgi:hypothetical protein
MVFQAGVPDGSPKAWEAMGLWVAASSAAVLLLRRPLRKRSRYWSALA